MVLLVDARALDLEEEALAVVQQRDRLGGHPGQLGLGGGQVGVRHAPSRVLERTVGRRVRTRPLHRQVARGEEPEHRLVLVGLRDGVHLGLGLDDLVAADLGLLRQGQVLVLARHRRLAEGRLPAAHGDVGARGEDLLGDRAVPAVLERVRGAGLARGDRAVAGAFRDVRGLDRGGRVLDLGGGDVPRLEAALLGQLEERHLLLALDVDGDRAAVGLGARRPAAAAGRGVGHVVGLAGLPVQREGRVLPGEGQAVDAGEAAVRAELVVAGGGDLGVAHAVADEEDDVLGPAALDLLADLLGLVAAEPGGPAVLGELRGSGDRSGDGHAGAEGQAGRGEGDHDGASPGSREGELGHGPAFACRSCPVQELP